MPLDLLLGGHQLPHVSARGIGAPRFWALPLA